MMVSFKKLDQNGAALTCRRADGSSTWQRPKPSQAAYFALHDLTHFACESELPDLNGFFSLIASGWEIEDFEKKQKENELHHQAVLVEVIVALLDTEWASRSTWSANEFNTHIQMHASAHGHEFDFQLNDQQLENIRRRRNDLFQQWHQVRRGESLELEFKHRPV